MIVLDTNVISEMTRPAPDPEVLRWLDDLEPGEAYLTVVTVAELLDGVERMPTGRRRSELAASVADLVDLDFVGRVLPFDVAASFRYATVLSVRRGLGRPIGMADAIIAGIALEAGATLATRNTRDFDGVGLPLVNPWTAPG
ncbi:type II toxin-antitoxin system VapC family toxin [Occultella glacieicola]|uniref:Ribonuclease VapC n=1 Tax=Occultella glacieicola TaxID=2518684 RepID=A0ABY2E668_9MICO|nr:type II toxin-antitoxin system VapC family toxin [Occultella glacieicola]TDE96077.1 type II toxin-antitoxin system VapC family toxin [Occultella glacieicola]